MWGQAVRVAVVGFSVVFAGLAMLALGVKAMSFLCRLLQQSPKAAGASKGRS